MKKFVVIIALFALPIVAYLFFASGVNNFARLPVLNEDIRGLEGFHGINGEEVSFDEHITILGFFGKNPLGYTGNSYNLAEKIYDPYYKFKNFQFVFVVTEKSRKEVLELKKDIDGIVNTVKWKFVLGEPDEIRELFESLETDLSLNPDLSSPNVFIIDKKGTLRGRTKDEDEGILYGYDTRSVAELDDKMTDDVKVILAEYRLALKKYNSKEEN